jgi:hypothetical protein
MENQRSQFAVTDVALDHGRDGADRAKAYIGATTVIQSIWMRWREQCM